MNTIGFPIYVVLAEDPDRRDTICFAVQAATAEHARRQVGMFYAAQGWESNGLRFSITKKTRFTDERPVQFIGHAQEHYQDLHMLSQKLARYLLTLAGDTGHIEPLDEVRAFLSEHGLLNEVPTTEESEDEE